MKQVDYGKIKLDIPDHPIALLHSGGVDSSLLLYMFMSHMEHRIDVYTFASNEKGRMSALVSSKVLERCIQQTKNSNVRHITNYGDSQTVETLFGPLQEALQTDTKLICFAETANPPPEVYESFKEPISAIGAARNPDETRELYLNKMIYRPFTNINKQDIAELYKQLDIIDTIFPITRSCEVREKLEYYDHCGECWWCEERNWGFSNL